MASIKRDFYAVLHVSRDAPPAIVRSSYQTLMQKLRHHPDLGGDPAMAASINEAYAVLSDAKRRASYDAQLRALDRIAVAAASSGPDVPPPVAPARKRNPLLECVFCETPHEHGRNIERDAACRSCDSPLWPITPQRFESEGNRAIDRVYKAQPITYFTHARQVRGYTGQTENVSPNGLRFLTRNELNKGQYVRIVGKFLDVVATVTNCEVERKGSETNCLAGVEFVTLRFISPLGGFVSKRV